LSPERALATVTADYDYVLDCIDSITPKLNLIIAAKRKRVKNYQVWVQAENGSSKSKSRRY
jgi:tRNA A37 threonylcarbamoyladenosine dehydratase